ncbi:MAG: hypothetical protein QQN63_09640 [Nitrosopumilus sp.]
MTVPGTAPVQLVSLAAILGASVAWIAAGSTAADIYWPEFAGTTSFSTKPLAVIDLEDARTAMIMIYSDIAQFGENDLVALATDLRFQLPTRYRLDGTGLFISVDPDVSEIGEPELGSEAFKGAQINVITITLAIGVDQDA